MPESELVNPVTWHAVYTQPRHEKKVAQQLAMRSMEAYLPLYESLRRWKDRRTKLTLPLFPGYVFVKMALPQRIMVLEIASVVQIVGPKGQSSMLADEDIERLRFSLTNRRAEPHPYLASGKKVRIKSGPLMGLEGTVTRWKAGMRIVVSIDAIQRSVAMELESADLEGV